MTHEAGRALDALVAEKVMGWIWIDHPTENIRYFRPEEQLRYGAIVSKDASHEIDYTNQLPHYSTDIAAAWQVVEKLRLRIEPYDARIWVAETCDGKHVATALTVPHAICLAALRAVGVEA